MASSTSFVGGAISAPSATASGSRPRALLDMPDRKIGTPAVASASQCSPKLPVPEALHGRGGRGPRVLDAVAGEEDLDVVALVDGGARHQQRERAARGVLWAGCEMYRGASPWGESTQTGVHAAQVGLALLELLEQVDQLLALLAINSGAQAGLIVDGDLRGPLEHPAPLAREVQPAHAAILGIRPPLDEARLLEVVHERDHPAGRDGQPLGERLLRRPSEAATKRISRNSRGPMPTGSSASMKPFEEKKPSCEIRKPTLRGGPRPAGGSIRRSSRSSLIKERLHPKLIRGINDFTP